MSVKFIDFSPKHDVFLRNADGSLSRMDEPYFESEEIAPRTWKILSGGDYSYVIAGDGMGLSIDCGYGAGNIRAYAESLAGVPVPWVANSHDHFDHTANNAYFEKAFMSAETAKYATIPFQSFSGIDFHADEYERVILNDGDIIPLPGRELQAFLIPDHARGSMVYLDRVGRILFSGDEFFPMGMGKPLNMGLTSWVKNLEKINAYRDEFDALYGGNGLFTKEYFDAFLACARYALDHEGVPAPAGGRRPTEPERDAEGHIIYDRVRPHAGDHGTAPMPEHKPENMRVVEYAGTKITYDITMKEL